MPRRMRTLSPAPAQPRSIVASSAVIDRKKTATIYKNSEEWQRECYRHYRICGEARFAAQFFGHALSKALVFAASEPGNVHSEPLTEGPAKDRLDELFAHGQPTILAPIGIHLTIAGECYLIGRTPQPDLTEAQAAGFEAAPEVEKIWEIRSVMEVKSNGTGGDWWIDQTGMIPPRINLDEADTVIRIWTPDPAHAGEPDSPFRSLLPILEEIEWLTRYTFAQCSSRLTGAGLVVFPEEIDFPPPPDSPEGTEDRSKVDNLLAYLADGMLAPIEDPGDPRAKVPLAMTAPGEWIDSIKWLTFWSELDTEAKSMRQENIARFALGMDLPPERILGLSLGATAGGGGGGSRGVNHWGAWQIDEDTIKMHVEPMLDVVVWALTTDYADGEQVGYDTSKLRLRPDRSQEALELWDRGLLKGSVAVTENGFTVEDMPEPDEQKMWLLMKMASGSATPEMVVSALQLLGIPMPQVLTDQYPNESRPTPSLEDHPGRDLPDPNESEAGMALIAASDALVFRALERAGNRIRQVIRDAGGTVPTAASYEVHTLAPAPAKTASKLLSDAWACAPQVLAGCGADPEKVLPLLDGYTLSLLTSGQPHTREALVNWMAAS